MSNENCNRLMFQTFSSVLNPGFWQHFTNIKLNKLKLSQEAIDINGSYSCNLSTTLPCLASFDTNSFNGYQAVGTKYAVPLFGQLVCMNIMQEFIDYDKKAFLNNHGLKIWQSVCNGEALKDPERCLSRFGLLVYADLKKYKFFYWFCFPAVNYPTQVNLIGNLNKNSGDLKSKPNRPISTEFSDELLAKLQEEYEKPSSERTFQRGYFIVKLFKLKSNNLKQIQVFPLTQYGDAIRENDDQDSVKIYFAYNDPSSSQVYPGWPLRNYLCLIAVQFKLEIVNIIRLRMGQSSGDVKIDLEQSMILEVEYKLDDKFSASHPPTITGWEKNESQQMMPKRVDLSSLLDAKKLAEDAVNLNLRLMKWRLLPELDLDKIANTKCLILGCGTLGCNVARGLLAWGIKKITLVDNSKISYSNPVRQNLYNFDDCAKPGGAYKAEAAAASLRRTHPTINVAAHVFSIPMPGHHVADNLVEQTKKDVERLEHLIEENDAIFLLMDTRESRWLPSVIAISKQRLVINAAIGFDTFLLQRYGIRSHKPELPSTSKSNQLASDQLGCYFCNDIVAPGDSTLDRTLDQQCTVSRPGVSMMVSAMAVELLASVVSSKMGTMTPAPLEIQTDPSFQDDIDFGCELGIVPHSIRGNLSRYHIYLPTSPCFNKCAACSSAVIEAYKNSGYEFLSKVFEDPSYLEEIAGLKDLQNVSDNVWALESDDEDLEDLDT